MLRGYVIYILMFVALGVGLWAVLRFGARLKAPQDIAGQYNVHWETGSPSGMGYHGTMRIDQSGRYCTITFDDDRPIGLKLVAGAALGQSDPTLPLARLSGEEYHVTLTATNVRDQVRVEIAGSDHHRGLAERQPRPTDRTAAAGPSPTIAPVADARP